MNTGIGALQAPALALGYAAIYNIESVAPIICHVKCAFNKLKLIFYHFFITFVTSRIML